MRICGVDPGLRTTGYGVIEACGSQLAIVDAGTIGSLDGLPLSARLAQLHAELRELLVEHHPEVVVVEQVYSHYRHPQTAVLMGHARGVLLLAAAQQGVVIRQYPATRIKRCLTGNGRASKIQVQHSIQMTFHLAECPEPHDVADALAIALCDAVVHGQQATLADRAVGSRMSS